MSRFNFPHYVRLTLIALIAVAATGCTSLREAHNNIKEAAKGPGHDFNFGELSKDTGDQTKILTSLIERASPPPGISSMANKVKESVAATPTTTTTPTPAPAVTPITESAVTDWDTVVLAGMDYADSKCEAYLHTLFRLDRDRKTLTNQGSLLGTAAAGAMAATKAAAKDVALVAIAFGLFNSTTDNLSSNLLYTLEPSSVRTIVKTLQAGYRKAVPTHHNSRPAAFATIRGYAQLCVPSNIEAEVNLAVKNANPTVTKGDPQKGVLPAASNSGNKNSESADSSIVATEKLTSFIFQKEAKDAEAARTQLKNYLVAIGYGPDVDRFLLDPAQAAARVWAAHALKILD